MPTTTPSITPLGRITFTNTAAETITLTTDPETYELPWKRPWSRHEIIQAGAVVQQEAGGLHHSDMQGRMVLTGDEGMVETAQVYDLLTWINTGGQYKLTDWMNNNLTVILLELSPLRPFKVTPLWSSELVFAVTQINTLMGFTPIGTL